MANFKRIVNNNENINNDLKEIIVDCYSSIYEYLGKENFIRWIDDEQIGDDAKKLIVDFMTEEEKNEHQIAAGFAQNNRLIKFRDPNYNKDKLKDVGIHEVYHILTSHNERFKRFMNEGLTEYMNYLTNGKPNAISYYDNVKTVEFMHKMLGNSLIKAYFLGKDKRFDDKFIQFMAKGKDDYKRAEELINNFYWSGEKYHDAEHTVEFKSPEEAKKAKGEIKLFLKEMCKSKARQITKNMELYKDGKFVDVGKRIDEILESYPFFENYDERVELHKDVLGEIIESSYLLNDVKEEEKETRKKEIVDKVIEIKRNDNSRVANYVFKYYLLDQYVNEKDLTSHIFQSAFKDAKDMDIVEFVEKVQQIIPHVNAGQREISALVSQYAIQAFGSKTDIVLIDQLIKQNINNELFGIERDKEKDTIESQYRQIDENSFVEKRDNRFYLIKLNENGKIEEVPFDSLTTVLENGNIVHINGTKSKDLNVDDRNYFNTKMFKIKENGKGKIIEIDDDLSKIKLYGVSDKYADLGKLSSKDFLKLAMVEPEIRRIRENFKEYRIKENDEENPYEVEGVAYSCDVDMRSRSIDFEKFKSDLDNISKIYVDDEKGKILQGIIIDSFLDSTYKTKREKQGDEFIRPENIQKAYDEIKECIINGDFQKDELKQSIDLLNGERKRKVEENSRGAVIFFSTPEAEKKFRDVARYRKVVKQTRLKFILDRKYLKDYSPVSQYYESVGEIDKSYKDQMRETTFGLEGMALSASPDDRERKLKYDVLCEELKEGLKELESESDRTEIIDGYTERVLRKIYGLSKSDIIQNQELGESIDVIKENVRENVLHNQEIDKEKADEKVKILSDKRSSEVKEQFKKSVIFIPPDAATIYTQLCHFSKTLSKSDFEIVKERMVNDYNKKFREEHETKDERGDR